MKKVLCYLLAGVLLLSITACKRTSVDPQQTSENTESTQQQEIAEQSLPLPVFVPGSVKVIKAVDKTAFSEPIVIPYSQGPILVNPPVFTGIPAESLYNQNAYRFYDGVATVTVNTEQGIRNLIVNKAGQIVDNTDYHNPVRKDTLPVKPADIGAEYYAGDGLYAYTDGNLYGLMDENGKVVTDALYYGKLAITFCDGYAMVGKPDGTYVMLNTFGKEYGSFTGGRSNGYGTAVIATGGPDKYTCHLNDRDGNRISDGYDNIGFLYEGLAPVEMDNKIGFINYNGKVMLSPTIAFDTLIYHGNENRGYNLTFAEEDTFLLPIGGEMAVITLDRNIGKRLLNLSSLAYEAFLDGEQGVKQADGRELFVKDYGATGDGISAYAYHDVSGDGIPELFLKADHTTILSYQDGGIVEWYTSGSWQPVYLLENGGVLDVYHNLGSHYRYLSFDATGIATDISFSEPAGQPNGTWAFKGEEVSEAQWEELTKPYLSQKQTEPDWKQWYNYTVDRLPHSYRQVLNNEKKLYAQGEGEMFLKNYLFPESGNSNISIGNLTDWNGQKMLAIEQLEGTVVLCESDGVVYGKRYGFRSLYDLRADGVYNWIYTDDEGLHYGVSRLVFQDGEFADVELFRIDQKGFDQVQYTLEGKEATQGMVEAYSAALKGTEVTWVKISLDQ